MPAPSFESLLAAHAGIVRKVAATYAWDPDDRADLMQDIRAALWRAWPRFDHARPFATWMYRIALNVAVSHVRGETTRRRHHVAFDADVHETPVPAHDHEADEHAALLRGAMQALDPLSRALLLMHLDDRSHQEIGEVLGIRPGNVATRLNRLRDRLRRSLAPTRGDSDDR